MLSKLPPTDNFTHRHIGPRGGEIDEMLAVIGVRSLDQLIDETVPAGIRMTGDLRLPEALDERAALDRLRALADANQVRKNYLGTGYHGTITPPVILRNLLEDPGWYTAYTPYQAEISQGRLEGLLIYQTMVEELTAMELANASLLDEATAAAEAMAMAHRLCRGKKSRFLASDLCHPQTLAVLQTRAGPLGIDLVVLPSFTGAIDGTVFGALIQYPTTDGRWGRTGTADPAELARALHGVGAYLCVAADLLSLTLLSPPGEWGADIVIGSSQRFGVPMGYGGPHAAFLATRQTHMRQVPGRIIGVSRDRAGRTALRMALQTREQHIRREKATSNICTAQVLLAVIAGMYAVWHGPEGLTRIASRINSMARTLAEAARGAGLTVHSDDFFDTLRLDFDTAAQRDAVRARADAAGINLRSLGNASLCISLDETTTSSDLADLAHVLGASLPPEAAAPMAPQRTTAFLTHQSFHAYRSETEMMRFLHRLKAKDIALDTAMIPLGSCTMKLNAAAEMIPVTWPGFGGMHPFAPPEQARGYAQLFADLQNWLAEITGFDAISLQPNAGSQGEYAGLMCIAAYHRARGQGHRDICLIPASAHGTNPASAILAGMQVVAVRCDDSGNIDVNDLRDRATEHAAGLAALMVTYPSTHGVFEEAIREICEIVHQHGGQVYMDGANMNAMVGLCRPGDVGADVCHLNLHKTFAIPHGGGGPGMGPIGVKAHLAPHLPGHPLVDVGGAGAVSAAPWGSPSILPISWAYIAMLGPDGVRASTRMAILSANYLAARLSGAYPVLYTGKHGRCAHECILDLRHFKKVGIEAEDVAKRLMDYGFHAPTMSFPVAGTLMVEPTESESKQELDRLVDAMLSIRQEIQDVEDGKIAADQSPLKLSPHTAEDVTADAWDRAYSRRQAAFPVASLSTHKYWPTVGRIDNAGGDRNLVCSCHGWDAMREG